MAREGRLAEKPGRAYKLKLKGKGYRPSKPDDLVQIGSVFVFEAGVKRHIIAGVDLTTRFAFPSCYPRLNSLAAQGLVLKCLCLAAFALRRVQTDNGSEFAQHFRGFLAHKNIVYFFC